MHRRGTAGLVLALFAANAVAIVWLWYDGGNIIDVDDQAELVTSLARITGLLGAYLALVQVLLLARLPWLERLIGFDRLTIVHRWNGFASISLVCLHTVLSVWGYALLDDVSLWHEVGTLLGSGTYAGMVTATVGTALLLVVTLTSLSIARRSLSYEWWYVVHLAAYAGIALAWFHQIPTGNELALDEAAAWYWRGLYLATLVLLVVFRFAVPIVNAFRFRLRVAHVVPEGGGVVSLKIVGSGLERLDARAGQFFLWRFLAPGRWWEAHPFSLSESPRSDSLRITAKAVGDFTRNLPSIEPGTRVVAEGPFGVFTRDVRHREKVASDRGRHRHHADPRAPRRARWRRRRPLSRAAGERRDLSRRTAAGWRTRGGDSRRPRDRTAPTCSRQATSASSSPTWWSATFTSAAHRRWST